MIFDGPGRDVRFWGSVFGKWVVAAARILLHKEFGRYVKLTVVLWPSTHLCMTSLRDPHNDVDTNVVDEQGLCEESDKKRQNTKAHATSAPPRPHCTTAQCS